MFLFARVFHLIFYHRIRWTFRLGNGQNGVDQGVLTLDRMWSSPFPRRGEITNTHENAPNRTPPSLPSAYGLWEPHQPVFRLRHAKNSVDMAVQRAVFHRPPHFARMLRGRPPPLLKNEPPIFVYTIPHFVVQETDPLFSHRSCLSERLSVLMQL